MGPKSWNSVLGAGLLLLSLLICSSTASPVSPMPGDSHQGHDMELGQTSDDEPMDKVPPTPADPDSAQPPVPILLEYIEPKVELIILVNSNEEDEEQSSTTADYEYGDAGTTENEHSIEKRNKHKIRYNIKSKYDQYRK